MGTRRTKGTCSIWSRRMRLAEQRVDLCTPASGTASSPRFQTLADRRLDLVDGNVQRGDPILSHVNICSFSPVNCGERLRKPLMVPPPQTHQFTLCTASKVLKLPFRDSFEDGREYINAGRYARRCKLEAKPFLASLAFGKDRWEAVQEALKDEDASEIEGVENSVDIAG